MGKKNLRYLYFSSLILCYTLYFHVINLKALVIRHFKIKVLQNNMCSKLLKDNKDETSGLFFFDILGEVCSQCQMSI